jgi:hypothetical protein
MPGPAAGRSSAAGGAQRRIGTVSARSYRVYTACMDGLSWVGATVARPAAGTGAGYLAEFF